MKNKTNKVVDGHLYELELYIDQYQDEDGGYENAWFIYFANNNKVALDKAKKIMLALNNDYDNLKGVIVPSQSKLERVRISQETLVQGVVDIPDDILE